MTVNEKAILGFVSDLFTELEDVAREMAERQDRKVAACMSSLILPMLKDLSVGKPPVLPAEIVGASDLRQHQYSVKFMLWDVQGGVENSLLLAETDTEILQGFNTLPELVQDYAEMYYEEHGVSISDIEVFADAFLHTRIKSLRTMMSRSGGQTTLRLTYKSPHTGNDCMCHVLIKVLDP